MAFELGFRQTQIGFRSTPGFSADAASNDSAEKSFEAVRAAAADRHEPEAITTRRVALQKAQFERKNNARHRAFWTR